MAPRVSEGSENQSVQSVAGRSGRIRREQSGGFRESVSMCVNECPSNKEEFNPGSPLLPPSLQLRSPLATREPLRLLPFQLQTSGNSSRVAVCPPHEPVVIWVQLSNSRKRNQSRGCEKINVRSARDQKVKHMAKSTSKKCLKSLVP